MCSYDSYVFLIALLSWNVLEDSQKLPVQPCLRAISAWAGRKVLTSACLADRLQMVAAKWGLEESFILEPSCTILNRQRVDLFSVQQASHKSCAKYRFKTKSLGIG